MFFPACSPTVAADMAASYFRNIQYVNNRSTGFRSLPGFFYYRMAKSVLFWVAGDYQVFHNALHHKE
jgi:hypothetical protein